MSRADTPEGWDLIDWDGNPSLKLKCWRKKFGRGHVSVGVGDFTLVSFNYGANSDDSYSTDRNGMTEVDAMLAVENGKGKELIADDGPAFQDVSETLSP